MIGYRISYYEYRRHAVVLELGRCRISSVIENAEERREVALYGCGS